MTSRGNRRSNIYLDEHDYRTWLDLLSTTAARFDFIIHAFCQMPNHYHLVLETRQGRLSQGMRYLNGIYCQSFNKRHELTGHVVQGRYHALLIQKESHLLELARYVALNPIRAKLASNAADWHWSNHRYLLGIAPPPSWLETEWLLNQFGNGPREARIHAYHDFVRNGLGQANPLIGLHRQRSATNAGSAVQAMPLTLHEYAAHHRDRNEAIRRAYLSATHTIQAIATHFKVSPRTVKRALHPDQAD